MNKYIHYWFHKKIEKIIFKSVYEIIIIKQMENNEPIFVYQVVKCYPKPRKTGVGYCKYDHYTITGINNFNRELILTHHHKIIHVPFSQLKWGPTDKFIHEKDYVYVIYDILLKVPIDNKSEFFTAFTLFSPAGFRIVFDPDFSVQKENLKCSNIMFCIRKNFPDDVGLYSIAKYPIPLTKILLFVAGYTEQTSIVSCLIKDIFVLIYEFYQQIYPLLEANNE